MSITKMDIQNYIKEGRYDITDCTVEDFFIKDNKEVDNAYWENSIFTIIGDVVSTTFKAAGSVVDYIGTGKGENLKSVKIEVDKIASDVYMKEMKNWKQEVKVATSEGKDEFGNDQPGVATDKIELKKNESINIAIDAIDGTTLTALGLPGAESICAVGKGFRAFPDLQAYSILADAKVMDKLDFTSLPEVALEKNLQLIADGLGKRVDQLVMVTHGYESKKHHQTMIDRMRALGVTVVIPEPVTIEVPYTIGACLETYEIDGIIGVFGLPEVAINSILTRMINPDKAYGFRIVGNEILKRPEQNTLDGIFDLSSEEEKVVNGLGLDKNLIYNYDNIVSGSECIFACAAVTDDPMLGLNGMKKERDSLIVEGLIALPFGNVFKVRIAFKNKTM
ncbi:MAG TPA: hypothetical protein DCP90_04120 [Clostridiales bacterium]|nr:MAG: hypothetical protein A2Y22_07355 [Clostridiales bacterium GWD2_32_59]HAN09781.1 hypothetical protein [Clostridiales bacterium]